MIIINGISFELNNNLTAKIINSNNAKGDIFIPYSINHQSQDYIITRIDQSSFKSNTSIKSITFAKDSKINYIDNEAFSLSSIPSISIPSHVRYIGDRAFYQCLSLKTITFLEDSELQTINKEAFAYSSLQKISIPKSVTKIGESAFSKCRDLYELEIPENSELAIIEKEAFSHISIKFFYIPSKLTEIKEGWCNGISKLNEIKISPQNKVFKIHENKILLGKTNKTKSMNFDCLLFSCRNIENSTIPSTIKYICPFSFSMCLKLKSIEIPENSELISLGKESFMNCPIHKIFIPKHVKIIDERCFYGCTQLESVTFQENSEIESINDEAFTFSRFSTFSIPSNLTQIGIRTFSKCGRLKNLEISENSKLEIIKEEAFSFTSIENFFIPSKLIELKEGWCLSIPNLNKILISPKNGEFKIHEDKILIGKINQFSMNFDRLLFACRDIENIFIPSSIKQIDPFAFSTCKKLKIVEFSKDSNLIKIDKKAFSFSSLKFASFPNKLNHLDNNVFAYCKNLKSIEFLSDSLNLGFLCFERCQSLFLVSFPNIKHLLIMKNSFLTLDINSHIFVCSNAKIISKDTM